MKIITWNVNGIRAVERKGEIQRLLNTQKPDVLMVQETKGNKEQFSAFLTAHDDYQQYYNSAEKKGYAGTALWMKNSLFKQCRNVKFTTQIPDAPNADEGRLAQLSFTLEDRSEKEPLKIAPPKTASHWDLLSVYFPNGGKSAQAWIEKLEFYARTHDYINLLRQQGHIVLVGGDMNVAHTEIDLARPTENAGKIGFHPKERAWMDRLSADGWVDVWRARNPGVTDVYSWWHMISRGRERNVGWRIDYFLIDKTQMNRIKDIAYLPDQMGSDHCPLLVSL